MQIQAMAVTEATFQAEVLAAAGRVLVDFWGDDCVKCAALAPLLDELAAELAGRVKVVKFWAHPQMPIVQQYGLKGIPTLILFQDGEPVRRTLVYAPKQAILEALELR